MKSFKQLILWVVVSFFFSALPLHAAPSWTYVGLKGEFIKTILPVIGNSPNGIMVGTNTGIWHFEYTWWDHSFTGLPVHDIIKTPDGKFLAAMGNGSDSDGVYIGKVWAIGEPGTRWRFSLLIKCPEPTALAFAPMEGSCVGRLYVGNVEGVRTGLLCKDSVKDLTPLTGAPNPFAITSMVIGSDDNMLYAGGDHIFVEPGPGLVKSNWLLRGNTGGLTALKRMNVTSIAELPLQSIGAGGLRDMHPVAIATLDSGIQFFISGGALWKSYPAPERPKPILDIAPFRTTASLNWTEIIAATETGVYRQCPPNADCVWSKIENLPGTPTCIAQYQGAILWAGTDSGVYRYENPTAVDRNGPSAGSSGLSAQSIRTGNGSVLFKIEQASGRDGMLAIYDTRGRCVKSCAITKTGSSVSDFGKGLFLFRITINKKTAQVGRVMCY